MRLIIHSRHWVLEIRGRSFSRYPKWENRSTEVIFYTNQNPFLIWIIFLQHYKLISCQKARKFEFLFPITQSQNPPSKEVAWLWLMNSPKLMIYPDI